MINLDAYSQPSIYENRWQPAPKCPLCGEEMTGEEDYCDECLKRKKYYEEEEEDEI